jgi:hypothetical protein
MSSEEKKAAVKCDCKWKECASITASIANDFPPKHPWKGFFITWQERKLDETELPFRIERMLLLAAACKHVTGVLENFRDDEPGKYKTNITIARHHYPVALCAYLNNHKPKRLTQFLKRTSIATISGNDTTQNRLQEDCNRVGRMASALIESYLPPGTLSDKFSEWLAEFSKLTPGLENLFICAPLVPRTEAMEIGRMFSRDRVNRQLSLPPSVPPKKRKKQEPLAPPAPPKKRKVAPDAVLPKTPSRDADTKAIKTKSLSPKASSPDLTPSAEAYIEKLQSKIREVGLEAASKTRNFISAVSVLRFTHQVYTPIWIGSSEGKQKYMFLCRERNNQSCETYRVLESRQRRDVFCKNCQGGMNRQSRRISRQNNPKLSDEHRRYDDVTDDIKKRLYSSAKKENEKLKQQNKRLVEKIEEFRAVEKEIMLPEGEAVDMIQAAFKFATAKETKEKFRETIVNALMAVDGEDDNEDRKKEKDQFARFIAREISNKQEEFAGNPRQVRYLPSTINLAMNVYLHNRSAYEKLRENSPGSLPNVRLLQTLKSFFSTREGCNPACYSAVSDGTLRKNLLRSHVGHLCMDEVKIKSDLVWNSANDEILGFCNIGTSPKVLQDALLRMTSDDATYESKDRHAVQVNQWVFRSAKNDIFMAEFFYNTGSLDSDDLLRQLLHVVGSCESIGLQVYGICCDAGGPNEGLFGIFRNVNKEIKDSDAILDEDMVSMINPYEPSRRIWLFHCSAHNVKNVRNNLFRSFEGSDPKRTKLLMRYLDGVVFGWQSILDSYLRQKERKIHSYLAASGSGARGLNYQSVHLDNLTVMNVSFAKRVFGADVLAEITYHCRNELYPFLKALGKDIKCEEEDWYTVDKGTTGKEFMEHASVLREAAKLMSTTSHDLKRLKSVKADICVLEYLATMHTIFIERFVNSDWRITLANIDDEVKAVKDALQFLCKLQSEKEHFVQKNPALKGQSWIPHLLAVKTFRNIRIGISGYFGYARDILKANESTLQYVPALHSTQSILEAQFSRVRAHNHDCTSQYQISASGYNALHVINHGGSVSDVKAGACERNDRYTKWRAVRGNRKTDDVPLATLCSSTNPPSQPFTGFVLDALLARVAEGGFAVLLMNDPVYCDVVKQSIHTPQEKLYQSIVEGDFDNELNRECQKLINWCWNAIDHSLSLSPSSKNPRRHYHYHLYLKMCETDLNTIECPSFRNRLFMGFLVQRLSMLVLNQVDDVLKSLKPPTEQSHLLDMKWKDAQNHEVNGFVGWALFSIRTKLSKSKRALEGDDEIGATLKLLEEMSAKASDVVRDNDYMLKYYSFCQRLINRGGLTLVSPRYANLGREIIVAIASNVSFDEFRRLGRDYVKVCRERVAKIEDQLIPIFLNLSDNVALNKELRTKLFRKIVRKTFNARMGAFFDFYKEENLLRGTKGENQKTTRGNIKHISGTDAKNQRSKEK